MSRLRQFGLLLWKNYILQKRQPWVTLLELGAPTLFALVLLLVRTKVDSTYNKDPTYFRSYDLKHFPINCSHEVQNDGHTYKTVYCTTKRLILFSPELPHIVEVMKYIENSLNVNIRGKESEAPSSSSVDCTIVFLLLVDEGFPTEDALLTLYQNNSTAIKELLGAVVFDSESSTSGGFAQNIKIRIRFKFSPESSHNNPNSPMPTWHTELTFPVFQELGPRAKKDSTGGAPGYLMEGFLTLQHYLTLGIAKTMREDKSEMENVTVSVQRFPYPPYNDDNFLFALKIFFPLALMLSFIYPALNIVKNVVIEKEKRLKESMKMMGLSNWLHWSAWFLKYLVFLMLSLVFITILLTVKVHHGTAVLDKTDPSLLFVFLFVYIMATIAFCFMISTLFSKANSAAAGAGIIFFMAFIPYFIIFPRYNTLSGMAKVASCLLSNTALTMGAMVLTMWEGTGAGAQWSNFHIPSSKEDTLSMWVVTGMLVLDTVLYLLVAWYVEAVFPGDYGVPQPWYFPFTVNRHVSPGLLPGFLKTVSRGSLVVNQAKHVDSPVVLQKSYWCTTYVELEALLSDEANGKRSEFFERDPVGLMNGISIIGLSKVFSKEKIAVNNVNMNMYRGQITALLGHNGAGKTTTISILTGLFPPTTGTALVNGFDIREDIEGVHGSLGICPQHDILFDNLTVEEHLYFFCKLKGYLPDLVQCEIDRMLKALNLEDKCKALSKTLSGGMKRRLSVGIALCGGSQVVMLDEPTSGMDPAARRFTWDLLQSEKEDRTILLTTHFMEEADILGDRIAIMAEGEVQCCGSPLFLKRKYGAGYHLVLVKDGVMCDVEVVNRLVLKHVPRAEQESNVGAELTFSLPHESSQAFPELFNQLETRRQELGLAGYGASITTMEEVFLRVGVYSQSGMTHLAEKAPLLSPVAQQGIAATNPGYGPDFAPNGSQDSGVFENSHSPNFTEPHKAVIQGTFPGGAKEFVNRDFRLFWQQFRALFMKSVLHSYRNWILTASQVLLPVAIIAVTLTVLKTLPKPENSPERILNLDGFRGSSVPFIVSPQQDLQNFSEFFTSQFDPSHDKAELVPLVNNSVVNSLDSYLINKGAQDLSVYNLHCITAMAAEKNDSGLTLLSMFNNQAFHSPAIALTTLENALLKYLSRKHEMSIMFSNHPLPRTIAEQTSGQQNQGTEGYQVAQDMMFAMSFLMASFAPFLVRERSTKAKHLQRVSGVGLINFWLSTYLWHFLNYMIPCFILLLEFLAFNTEALCSPEQSVRILLVFVLHGLASLPFIYVLSFLFNVSSTAYTRLTLINFIAGIACLLSVTILEIPLLDLKDIARILDWTFSTFLPQFCLGRAIYNLYQNYQYIRICNNPLAIFACMSSDPEVIELAKPCCKGKCDDVCLPWDTNYLAWDIPGIGRLLMFLAVQCIFYNLLLVACELNVLRTIKYRLTLLFSRKVQPNQVIVSRMASESSLTDNKGFVDGFQEDEDVLRERNRINLSTLYELATTDALVLQDLSKRYSGGILAVDNLCLGVHRGECFGLLGLNGAGKTTTFKMLTGDEQITSGDARLNLFSVKTQLRKVQQELGYCPQYDALIDQMTGYETLTLFARLRGVPEGLIPFQVEGLSKLLYFHMHLHKMVKDYSGGNKRKLSTAVALIGDSPVVFLDEPTTGMDPVARRCLWDAILQVVRAGRSVILTSHSMEECEALCNRLVIMVNGRFCCLGSPQYLKNKFSQGFTLMVKVGRRTTNAVSTKSLSRTGGAYSLHSFEVDITPLQENVTSEEAFRRDLDDVKGFISCTFPNAVLKSIHQGLLHYQVPKEDHSWAQMFSSMEEAKTKFNIENYSVGQTTLEQVFLNFARSQRHSQDS